jgi:hypothetical protein
MDLKADIIWIQKEIAKITDPELIEVFKSLLKYRETKSSTEALDYYIDKSLQEVREGKVTSHDEVRKKYDKWL